MGPQDWPRPLEAGFTGACRQITFKSHASLSTQAMTAMRASGVESARTALEDLSTPHALGCHASSPSCACQRMWQQVLHGRHG